MPRRPRPPLPRRRGAAAGEQGHGGSARGGARPAMADRRAVGSGSPSPAGVLRRRRADARQVGAAKRARTALGRPRRGNVAGGGGELPGFRSAARSPRSAARSTSPSTTLPSTSPTSSRAPSHASSTSTPTSSSSQAAAPAGLRRRPARRWATPRRRRRQGLGAQMAGSRPGCGERPGQASGADATRSSWERASGGGGTARAGAGKARMAASGHVGSDVAVHVGGQRWSEVFWTSSDTLE